MPEKAKRYSRVIFPPEILTEADNIVRDLPDKKDTKLTDRSWSIDGRQERWTFDDENEFFADYRKSFDQARFHKSYGYGTARITIDVSGPDSLIAGTSVSVRANSRPDVERVFAIFEQNASKYRLPDPPNSKPSKPKIKVFIGHGHSPLWRDIKDHLHDKHGIDVEAYEVGARAGLTIRDVLDDMLTKSSFALLVLTAEDTDDSGALHARENVIHELGLFQGRLGWRKAIALVEEDVTEFSNIHGLQQIRFHKGNVQETFGEILATIKREFPESDKE